MRACQLIDAATVIENVNNCLQKPVNEAQTCELAKVEPTKQPAVCQKAKADSDWAEF